jgi:hypothetical protein
MNASNVKFITNFQKSRSAKIGASEIASCIPHPEKSGSVGGYDETALTIWEYKTGRKKREHAGELAEFGNIIEPVILKKWIAENVDRPTAEKFYRGYMLCELDKTDDGYPLASAFQTTDFLHHTRAETDFAISHADCINPSAHIIVEAKSRSSWLSKRGASVYDGYDMELKSNQGIPLKDFFQLQFQAAIYNAVYGIQLDRLYLAVLFDRAPFHSWEIKPDIKIQERLLEIASYMKKCIDTDTPPKTLAMNQHDIKIMYPALDEDYRIVSGDELQKAVDLAHAATLAAVQEKIWKSRKDDATDALSIILKDTKTVKGIIDGQIMDIASWQERAGAERIIPLSEIKKDDRLYKYMVKNELIKKSEDIRFVKVKLKNTGE